MNTYKINAKKFYEHFTQDAEIVLRAFQQFAICCWTESSFNYITSSQTYNIDRIQEQEKKDNYLRQNILAYFLLVVRMADNEVSKIFENHGVSLNHLRKYYAIPNKAYNKIKDEIEYARKYECSGYDSYLLRYNIFVNFTLFEHTDWTSVNTVADLVVNVLKEYGKNSFDYEKKAFKLDEVMMDIKQIHGEDVKNFGDKFNTSNEDILVPERCSSFSSIKYKDDPCLNRDREIRMLEVNLLDELKSVIIVGKPGVGKTTLAKGLAYRIQHGEVPKFLLDKKIIATDATSLISGANFVGDAEQIVNRLMKFLKNHPDYILYIDEIHTLMGVGAGSKGNNGVNNMLKQSLGEGQIKIIGATTSDELEILKKDRAFLRRFNIIELLEPSKEDTLCMMKKVCEKYQSEKNIEFDSEIERDRVLNLIYELSDIRNQMPDVAVYNPDASLTLLRTMFNYAEMDGENIIDSANLIEAIDQGYQYTEESKEEMKQLVKGTIPKKRIS